MLAKCANPICSTPFRRLSEGKLFLVESESAGAADSFDPRRNKSPRHIEYFWLCDECARFVTLTFDSKTGVMTVPLPSEKQQLTVSERPRKPVSAERTAGMLARTAGYHHD